MLFINKWQGMSEQIIQVQAVVATAATAVVAHGQYLKLLE